MPRLGLGLGLNIPRPIFLGGGGGIAQPTGFVAKYTAYNVLNFTLENTNEVSVWKDESTNGNDLTQATSGNRPILIQDANTYNNRVSFGSDDFMEGLPPQAGDFTYVIKLDLTSLSGADEILSSTGNSALVLFTGEFMFLRDTTGANDIALNLTGMTLETHVCTLVREGNEVRFYVDSILQSNTDVTGRTFTLEQLGAGRMTDSYLNIYPRALTQEEINYFSYLRDENGNILQPPVLPS